MGEASGGNLEAPEDGSKTNVDEKPKPPKPEDNGDAKPLPKTGADGPHSKESKRARKELMSGAAKGLSEEGTVSTLDVVLGIAFVMTLLFAIDQVRRWRAERGYIKVTEDPRDVEPLMMTPV